MADFNDKEYQAALEQSVIITDCARVPVPACAEHQNYIFISYSHKDYKKVYHDLASMYAAGVRFWYDEGLTAGMDWDDEVFRKICDPHCSGVVFYLSDSFFSSQSIYKEVLTVLGKNSALPFSGGEKNFFCVNLTSKMPSQLIADNYISDANFDRLCGENTCFRDILNQAFRDKATYIPFGAKDYIDRLLVQIRRNFNVIDLTGDDASLVGDYTGEMLNGKRNGYGICKYNNGRIYEGQWKDNKYHGSGRITYPEGDQREYLEGIFAEDKANGHCVFKLRNGDCYCGSMTNGSVTGHFTYTQKDGCTYVGDMVAGQRQGQGRNTYPETEEALWYEGQWLSNNPHGQGTMFFRDGSSYTGNWQNGVPFGQGKRIFSPRSDVEYYEGQWKGNKQHGQGLMRYKDGTTWEGIWDKDNRMDGFGTVKYTNGDVYHGQMQNGQRHGQGHILYNPNSSMDHYDGNWQNGVKSGQGTMFFRNGAVYEGQWQDNDYHGQGTITESDGRRYQGQWAQGKKSGFGRFTYREDSDYDYYEGQWENGEINGQGLRVYKNGETWEGVWKSGEPITGQGMLNFNGKIYRGQLSDGKRSGNGSMDFPSGVRYEGQWLDGEYHGQGTLTYQTASNIHFYTGQWVASTKSGQGRMEFKNGAYYDGQWLNDKYHGHGRKQNADGSAYEGQWENDKKTGMGRFTYAPGSRYAYYEGQMQDDKCHGKGKLVYGPEANVDYYEGDFQWDQKVGYGIMVFKHGGKYEGQWANNQYQGAGRFTYGPNSSLDYYEGQWLNSEEHGQGLLLYRSGQRWEGLWQNGKRWDGSGAEERKGGVTLFGQWTEGKLDGQGRRINAYGEYEGEMKNGEPHGQGTFTYAPNPQLWERYQGQWENGEIHGHGTVYMIGGSYYEGQWEKGYWHGEGTFYQKKVFGYRKITGPWVHGVRDWSKNKFLSWLVKANQELSDE